jgi:hypothetical protein
VMMMTKVMHSQRLITNFNFKDFIEKTPFFGVNLDFLDSPNFKDFIKKTVVFGSNLDLQNFSLFLYEVILY